MTEKPARNTDNTKSNPAVSQDKTAEKEQKNLRLSQALRANLQRRKSAKRPASSTPAHSTDEQDGGA